MNPEWKGKGHRGAVEGEGIGAPSGGGLPGPSVRWEEPSLAGIFPSSTKICWKFTVRALNWSKNTLAGLVDCWPVIPFTTGFDFLSLVGQLLPGARWAWVKREGLSRRFVILAFVFYVVFGLSLQICRFVLLATRLSTMRKASLREGDASTRDASSAHLAGVSRFTSRKACLLSKNLPWISATAEAVSECQFV